MKNLLFLDDEEYRHKAAYLGKANVTHAYTITQFVYALYHFGPFDVISLDHDLRADHYDQGPHVECGCVAAKLVTLLQDRPAFVIVHSFNSVAAREMVKQLDDKGVRAVWKPFSASIEPTLDLDTKLLIE